MLYTQQLLFFWVEGHQKGCVQLSSRSLASYILRNSLFVTARHPAEVGVGRRHNFFAVLDRTCLRPSDLS